MKTIRILFFPILALLAGCVGPINSSSGTPIDSAKVAQIVKGKTTRAEVEALLGKPENVSLAGDGRRMMAYTYSATDANVKGFMPWSMKTDVSMRTQSLQIFLSKDNVVEDYEMNDNSKAIQGDAFGRTHSVSR